MLRKLSAAGAWWVLMLICVVSFLFMLAASRTDSAIMDELAHIPAGYGYVHNLDYRLNPEHPPLLKALAMLPVLFLDPSFPTQSDAWQNQVNSQWEMGTEFLYQSGNDATAIVQTARIFPILITLLLIIFTFLLARGILGNWWALLPAALLGFSPTILAHGHYVTTDVGAAFGVVLATYYFLKYVESPTRKHLLFAGLSFGIAQILKFSTPFLVPLFLFLAFTLWIRDLIIKWRHTDRARRLKIFLMNGARWIWRLALIFIIGYAFVVYPAYALFTWHYPIAKQVSDTQFILQSFANGPTPAGAQCHGLRCLADLDIKMAGHALTRPAAEYLLGILMVFQRVAGGNTIYFLGRVVGGGGWIYFPLLFLMKEPIPSVAIVAIALALALAWMIRSEGPGGRSHGRRILDYVGINLPEFAMGSFVVLYWGYSMHSDLNIGVRHLIPTFPFIFILAASVWKKWVTKIHLPRMDGSLSIAAVTGMVKSAARSLVRSVFKYGLLVVLLVWLFGETASAAPHFLSYFNELGGGVSNGYHFVTDSNYDWGQDLLRLRDWVDASPAVDKIAVDYFGGGNPSYYLGGKEINWSSAKGNPADVGIHWLAVSANTLEGATQPLSDGQIRNADDGYAWLTALRPVATTTSFLGTLLGNPRMGNLPAPDARAGTSLFIYHL